MKAYTKAKLAKIEKTILTAVRQAKKKGLTIITDDWGVEPFDFDEVDFSFSYPKVNIPKFNWVSHDGCCCPGGAICLMYQPKVVSNDHVRSRPRSRLRHTVAAFLDVDVSFMDGFINRYDDNGDVSGLGDNVAHYQQGCVLGEKIRKQVFKKTNSKGK